MFAGATSRSAAGAPASFLGIDREWPVERRRGGWRGHVGAGRSPVVPKVRRHATIDPCALVAAVVRAIPVVQRAGGACDPACPRRRGAADRPAYGAVGIDDLARAAPQCCHARRRVGLSGHHGAVACRTGGSAAEASEAGGQRGAADVCAGSAGRHGRDTRRCLGSWADGIVERSPTRTAEGSALGIGVEPGADCPSLAARLPSR